MSVYPSIEEKIKSMEEAMNEARSLMSQATIKILDLDAENKRLLVKLRTCLFCGLECPTIKALIYHSGECTKHPLWHEEKHAV